MSTEYRFSHPNYDILTNPKVDNEKHVIGYSRNGCFSWCDYNGFYCLEDVKQFKEFYPNLIIRDESDNIISFSEFEKIIDVKNNQQGYAYISESVDNDNSEFDHIHLEYLLRSDWVDNRILAAKNNYRLDILVNDEVSAVRIAVAEQGYGLDKLIHDRDINVEVAVLLYLEHIGMDSDVNGWISANPDKCVLSENQKTNDFERNKISLSVQIDSAAARAAESQSNSYVKAKEAEPEI